MRHLVGPRVVPGGVAARFEPGAAGAEVVGQEPGEGVHLSHRQQATGLKSGEDLGQDAVRISHVVHGIRRPYQVRRAGARPARVQVSLDDTGPAGHVQLTSFLPEVFNHGRGCVHGGHLRAREAPKEGETAGAGTAAQVQDPAGRLIGGQLANPVDHPGQVVVQHLGVEVQEFGHDRLGRLVPAVVVVVLVMGVRTFHAPRLRGDCAIGIESCL